MITGDGPGKDGITRPISPEIDVPRLLDELQVTPEDLQLIDALQIPEAIRVPSTSAIKTETVEDVLRIVQPGKVFTVIGEKASSDTNEQPVGQQAIDGAVNRTRNGITRREEIVPGDLARSAWITIENGIFREGVKANLPAPIVPSGVKISAEGVDLTTDFDPAAQYQDRAVTLIRIPGQPVHVGISPESEAVRFPQAAVHAAYNAEGGFAQVTAGSKLAEMGLVGNKQNPHKELTADRPGGPLPRQDQMARVIIRGLVGMARENAAAKAPGIQRRKI